MKIIEFGFIFWQPHFFSVLVCVIGLITLASMKPVGEMCSKYRMAKKFLEGIHYSSIRR